MTINSLRDKHWPNILRQMFKLYTFDVFITKQIELKNKS